MPTRLNRVEAIIIIATLTLTIISSVFIFDVQAEVIIDQISPEESYVGEEISLDGQITTVNGSYEIMFDDVIVQTGNATLNQVSDVFIVPSASSGLHNITLKDVANATESTPLNFTVQTKHVIKSIGLESPHQFQEGMNVTLLAQISGGEPNRKSQLNITVENPAGTIASSPAFLIQTDSQGFGQSTVIYPSDFNGDNQTTYLAGIYELSLLAQNATLVTGNFTIGLTDQTEYHRFQSVNIQGANYTAMDNVTITIIRNNRKVFEQESNASDGFITANWTIPANASLGSYRVEMVKEPLEKEVPDIQNFTLVSKKFTSEIKALNLDQEPARGLLIEANNLTDNAVSSGFTNEEGIASLNIEATNYTFTAFWGVSDAPRAQVGETTWISLDQNLTGNQAPEITCTLAHIKITVKDEDGKYIPGVDLRANFTYMTRLQVEFNETLSKETDRSGSATFRNVFTNTSYFIRASRYDNSFYNFITNITSTSEFEITVPKYNLIIQTYSLDGSLLQDAQVKVYEWGIGSTGLLTTGNTGDSGQITFTATFGKYTLEVHKFNTLINKTTLLLVNQPTDFEIHCKLYPLSLAIKVVDFFGQSLTNINVTLEREGTAIAFANTNTVGIADFVELIGGNYRALAFVDKKPLGITTFSLEESKPATIRIAEVVTIGGILIESSHAITVIFLSVTIVAVLILFVYRRLKSDEKDE